MGHGGEFHVPPEPKQSFVVLSTGSRERQTLLDKGPFPAARCNCCALPSKASSQTEVCNSSRSICRMGAKVYLNSLKREG